MTGGSSQPCHGAEPRRRNCGGCDPPLWRSQRVAGASDESSEYEQVIKEKSYGLPRKFVLIVFFGASDESSECEQEGRFWVKKGDSGSREHAGLDPCQNHVESST